MCQALTVDKLHKTNIRATPRVTNRPVRVKGIGPRMSEVSDVMTVQVLIYDDLEEDVDRLRSGLLPLFSFAWHSLSID